MLLYLVLGTQNLQPPHHPPEAPDEQSPGVLATPEALSEAALSYYCFCKCLQKGQSYDLLPNLVFLISDVVDECVLVPYCGFNFHND